MYIRTKGGGVSEAIGHAIQKALQVSLLAIFALGLTILIDGASKYRRVYAR